VKIFNLTKNTLLAENAMLADNPFSRTKGLLGRKGLNPGEALVLKPFFMRFPIDVIFVNRQLKVVAAIPALKPYRLSRIYFSAGMAIELPTGGLALSSTAVGDTLFFSP
jgi:uncharacterized membrane protein (UPF0127 family)